MKQLSWKTKRIIALIGLIVVIILGSLHIIALAIKEMR